jgi:T-complex protein 1 subunit eta
MRRVCKATGAAVQTTVSNLVPEILGTCETFEEKQVGSQRYNIFKGCKNAKTATILLRGGGEQFIDEAERSIHVSYFFCFVLYFFFFILFVLYFLRTQL